MFFFFLFIPDQDMEKDYVFKTPGRHQLGINKWCAYPITDDWSLGGWFRYMKPNGTGSFLTFYTQE